MISLFKAKGEIVRDFKVALKELQVLNEKT